MPCSGDDRATRLAAVALAWNVFQHFYPYFDVVDADWDAALRSAMLSTAVDADESEFVETLERLVAQLHDGHGCVEGPGVSHGHVHPIALDWVGDQLVLTHVGSAGTTGVRAGDVLLTVNGQPASEAIAAREGLISAATTQRRRNRAAAELLAGPEGSEVTLAIRSSADDERTVTLQRTVPWGLSEPRPEDGDEVAPGVVYADLGRLTEEAFDSLVSRFAGARGLVFDFRRGPRVPPGTIGHLTDVPAVSPLWLDPCVSHPGQERVEFRASNWKLPPRPPRFTARAASIAGPGVISYGETYLGIVEHYKLAEIVGQPTAGTHGDVNRFTLPGGCRVTWTGCKVLKQDGSQHHGIGILPTVPVSRTIEGIAEDRDEVLEAAIRVVSD